MIDVGISKEIFDISQVVGFLFVACNLVSPILI